MALFSQNDKTVSFLTRFCQLKIDTDREDGGEVLGFFYQRQGTTFPLEGEYPRMVIHLSGLKHLAEFQKFTLNVLNDLYAYQMINIGDLHYLNSWLKSYEASLDYYFDPTGRQNEADIRALEPEQLEQEDTAEFGRRGCIERPDGTSTDGYYVRGTKLGGIDLSPYYVPLSSIVVSRNDHSIFEKFIIQTLEALRDIIINRRPIERCKECQQVFVVSRPGKQICSHRCAARASIRKKRMRLAGKET